MEPSEGFDSSGAMIEMICLFIAALGCMTTILPCCRALVLQCSSPPTMASSRFPLACLLLLTVVFALLASAPTPNLPVLLVREAAKPHRAFDAARQSSFAGTYTAEPGDRLEMTSSVLYFLGPGETLSFPEELEIAPLSTVRA